MDSDLTEKYKSRSGGTSPGPKGLIAMEIPDELLNRDILETHFKQFGEIDRMSFSAKNRHCIIHFKTPEDAARARESGSEIDPRCKPVKLYFTHKVPGGGTLMPVTRKLSSSSSSKGPSPPSMHPVKLLRRKTSASEAIDKKKLSLMRSLRKQQPIKSPETATTTTSRPNPFLSRPDTSSSNAKNPFDTKSDRSRSPIKNVESSSNSSSSFSNKPTTTMNPFESPTFNNIKPSSSPTFTSSALLAAKAFGSIGKVASENSQPFPPPSNNNIPKPPSDPIISKENKPPIKLEKNYDLLTFNPDTFEAQELFTKRYISAEDKYRALEARDKLLRARIPKIKVRVELASKLFGTCPDMCPEKERYMRQYQRQLTLFEIQSNSPEILVDHRKAIKLYSRSSADQEEPLPHELRPGSTLEMTMNYLLHNILPLVDNKEELLGEWYTFLWDRTRSIRKDITQQQLTNLQVVGLMEKCARFHIHCSSRLCELDLHSFDPKLNDENLMKCLQSLEHLYDDLRRRNIKCPNEPEFRAYQIMMNLNEGDILWDAQQRPDWVLKSPEVKIALKIHHSIFNRNFVEFFRLVRQCPYMFSCILHRYFFQVRCTALRSLWKSHSCPPKMEVQMSYSGVKRMLGYGDSRMTFEHLCSSHGITCEPSTDRLVMTRRSFMIPDSNIVTRENYLIESKLETTVAEAVNGGPLGQNPLETHVPHCSFDSEDRLIPGLVAGFSSAAYAPVQRPPQATQAQNTSMTLQPTNHFKLSVDKTDSARPTSFASVASQNSIFSGFSSKPAFQGSGDFRGSIFTGQSVFGGQGSQAASALPTRMQEQLFKPAIITPSPMEIKAKKLQQIEVACSETADKMLHKIVNSSVYDLSLKAMQEAEIQRKREIELRNKEILRDKLANEAVEKFTMRLVPELVADAAVEEIQRHEHVLELCEVYVEDLMETAVESLLLFVTKWAIKEKEMEEKRLMDQLTVIFQRLKMRIILRKWLAKAKAKQLERRIWEEKLINDMLEFPAANVTGKTNAEILKVLCGNKKSPNIVKAGKGTMKWLDTYDKINSLADSYKSKLRNLVLQIGEQSPARFAIEDLEYRPRKFNENYSKYCWKRKWPDVVADPTLQDMEEALRKTKAPRQDFNFKANGINGKEVPGGSKCQTKSTEESLLEEIQRFADEAKKEKSNFELEDTFSSEFLPNGNGENSD